MQYLKNSCFAVLFLSFTGCQIGYLVKSSYYQMDLLWSRTSIEGLLDRPNLDAKLRDKLKLAVEAKRFAETQLGLKRTSNYTSFVQLDRPYVTWVVSAAEKNRLKKHTWWFPIVGTMPYKGFFEKEDALELQQELKSQDLDTWVRGARAYSTLGWFSDPLLSTMTGYKDYDLVDVIIHELVHVTVFIKNNVEFNERLAVFFAAKGSQEFYRQRNQPNIIKQIDGEIADQLVFSNFLAREINQLRQWYSDKNGEIAADDRENRFAAIRESFVKTARPKMQTNLYDWFAKAQLNNARLLAMGTYLKDLQVFEQVWERTKGDFHEFLDVIRRVEGSESPERQLREWLARSYE